VYIEEIFIMGYFTNSQNNSNHMNNDDFYKFDNLNKNDIIDDKEIITQLNKKLANRYENSKKFKDSLENNDLVPDLENYQSYQVTQTIYDDILKPRNYF
jgi:hypothetical protein